jgi:hypothetical protein
MRIYYYRQRRNSLWTLTMHDETDASNICPRAGRWIGGCKFEPRYSRIPIKAEHAFWLIGQERIDSLAKRIYVRDVCVRCGKAIERSDK